MSNYIKRTWKAGEDISADKLNNIENGIAEAMKAAEDNSIAAEEIAEAKETAESAAASAAEAKETANEKAPAYAYGTADLTAGSSPLETGKLYFVYE